MDTSKIFDITSNYEHRVKESAVMLSDVIGDTDRLYFKDAVKFEEDDDEEWNATILWSQDDLILKECCVHTKIIPSFCDTDDELSIFEKKPNVYKKILYHRLSSAFDGDDINVSSINVHHIVSVLDEYESSPPLSLFKNMYNHIINEWEDSEHTRLIERSLVKEIFRKTTQSGKNVKISQENKKNYRNKALKTLGISSVERKPHGWKKQVELLIKVYEQDDKIDQLSSIVSSFEF